MFYETSKENVNGAKSLVYFKDSVYYDVLMIYTHTHKTLLCKVLACKDNHAARRLLITAMKNDVWFLVQYFGVACGPSPKLPIPYHCRQRLVTPAEKNKNGIHRRTHSHGMPFIVAKIRAHKTGPATVLTKDDSNASRGNVAHLCGASVLCIAVGCDHRPLRSPLVPIFYSSCCHYSCCHTCCH